MSQATDSALEAILNGNAPKVVPSRRDYPRFAASHPVVLESDQRPGRSIRGTTINLARSGMLASFDDPIPLGPGWQVTFEPKEHYAPELVACPHCQSEFPVLQLPEEPIRGTVVRIERADDDTVIAAVMFEKPLDSVS